MYVHTPPPRAFEAAIAAAREHGWPEEPAGYPHWDKLRHMATPSGFTSEQWWSLIKLMRSPRRLPLADKEGRQFHFTLPDEALRLLHVVDQRCAGEVAMAEVVTSGEQAKRRYLVNGLMEEAIRSSQLEGAMTSRAIAKQMLRSGREPNDRSERMIVNNYRALLFMREHAHARLTPALVCELQGILTAGTLEDPDEEGRVQADGEERVAVHDRSDPRVILHIPPAAHELPQRLERLCAFANDDDVDAWPFVHPVLRAIIIHFQLGYDHPFADGNGRTARALFSWYMAKHGYWLVEYLSISRILRDAPSQYTRSYLLTESDDGDTTYFALHQLRVIQRAIDDLYSYLQRKTQEIQTVEQLMHGDGSLNRRQLALLGDEIREPGGTHTFTSHAQVHRVTHETARADLSALADRGLLERRRVGRRYLFNAPPDLAARLRQ